MIESGAELVIMTRRPTRDVVCEENFTERMTVAGLGSHVGSLSCVNFDSDLI
jgi:hypothetical protein